MSRATKSYINSQMKPLLAFPQQLLPRLGLLFFLLLLGLNLGG